VTSAPLTILHSVRWNLAKIIALLACVVFWVIVLELAFRVF
jgi:hypothetical protein